jgi:two-component system, response regulator PdtaR
MNVPDGGVSLSIAIAEDDADLREILVRYVEMLGHRVMTSVGDGRSLVLAAAEHELDLAIVDFDMPVLDGLAAAEELTAQQCIPVILVSGYSELSNAVWQNEPVTAYLRKPITLNTLAEAIQAAQAKQSMK